MRTDPVRHPIPMAHILLPTDFSDRSLAACAYAIDLFGTSGHTYTLVNAYFDPTPGYVEMVDMTSTVYAAAVEGMADLQERFRALKGAANAVVTTEVVYGTVAAAMIDLCERKQVDLIVMGTQGAGLASLFGSNAAAVAKSSRVPVLIVPNEARFQGLRHILLADDHERVEPLAMRLLVRLAREHGSELTIAHILRTPSEEPDPRVVADYDATLSNVKHRYTAVQGDDVALALSNVAERDHVDLVAVLHRHTGLLDGLFHASVAKQLALHTRIPLLVLEH